MGLVDRWFARIGYGGGTARTFDTLDALARHHIAAVPFENLDILLGRGISLDPDVVERKLLDDRRGGYCFEQNPFVMRGLEALGFRVTPLSARVRLDRTRDMTPPRTHVFLRVDLDEGPVFVDVGVGAMSPTGALRWVDGVEQPTAHEPRRFVREGDLWFHQARLGADWIDVCEFTGEVMPPIDREVGNWYTSAHPASHFRSRLVAARAAPHGARKTLLNRVFSVRGADGASEKTTVDHPDALLAVLAEHFDLRFPAGTRFACSALDWPT